MSSRRSLWLGGGLLLTLLATWYTAGVDGEEDDLLAAPQRTGSPARPSASAPVEALNIAPMPMARPMAEGSPSRGARMTREGGNLFATQSWQPPPPPPQPVVAAPAPPPRAPALLFRYLGRLEEDGRVVAFLAEGAQPQPRVVRQGDLLRNYRVDEITPTGMRLTYLPLNETQRLLFGSTP